ncbi:MAG: hypothetical protein WAL75_23360 [Terracidiphilus sp.]
MRLRPVCALLIVAGISGCQGNQSTSVTTPTPTDTKRVYNATASVGDFLTVTIDPKALTISYNDVTNATSGTIPYTLNADGSYALNDPSGNLISAYEVPDYAMVIESMKSGPGADTPALITAVESGPISLSTFENSNYNYMQFRTAFGGMAIGAISIGSSAAQTSEYWPYGAISGDGDQAFHQSSIPLSIFGEDSSGTYLDGTMPDGGGPVTLFGTANGFFIVDSGNGSILGLQKASSAAFNPGNAGTYPALYYKKTNVQENNSGVETGTVVFGNATITITTAGALTMTDPTGATMTTGQLTPVSSASYLYGAAGELADPCWGMFTYRVTGATSQSDFFVSFVDGAVVFSKFKAPLPWNGNLSTYDYMYGVGLAPAS